MLTKLLRKRGGLGRVYASFPLLLLSTVGTRMMDVSLAAFLVPGFLCSRGRGTALVEVFAPVLPSFSEFC